jgi:intein/homing endonuclease
MERWTKEEINFLNENYKTMSYKDIGEKIGKTDSQIRTRCFKDGLVKNNGWSDDEINYIKENYQTMSTKDIAVKLGRTTSAVQLKAERCGLKKSPYHCDYRFFQYINTEEKAYWLGFIYADGWITKRSYCESGSIGIELQASDSNHLKKFNKSISGNYQIKFRDKACVMHGSEVLHRMCSIVINSKEMFFDLTNVGVTTDKSYTMTLPEIPKHLMKYFIRGYFDGDGCLNIRTQNNKKTQRCSFFSVSKDFIYGLREYLYENESICSYVYERAPQNENYKICYTLEIGGGDSTKKFLSYIYDNANIYLDRKYEKFTSFRNNTDNVGLAI